MILKNYIIGSYYIVSSLFRFSENFTKYLFINHVIDLPITKFDKINESIYSSIHGIVVSLLAALSLMNSLSKKDNELQYLTASICFSYFLIDLFKCLYNRKYLFILHHIAALYLLSVSFYLFYHTNNKGIYAMYLIFLLESNTFLLNLGFLLKEFKFHYSITCTSWIIHLIFFVLFRLVTIPRILFIYYYNEEINIISLSQLPPFFLILMGSSYWAYRQAVGINKYLKENSVI